MTNNMSRIQILINKIVKGKTTISDWIKEIEHALINNFYKKPSVPHIVSFDFKSKDLILLEYQISKIEINYKYLCMIGRDYNDLMDFILNYESKYREQAVKKANEYKEFLINSFSSSIILFENDLFIESRASRDYNSQYNKYYVKYKELNKDKNKKSKFVHHVS